MNFLITGGAGFIGSSLIDFLLKDKENFIFSIDNFDPFYEKKIKIENQKHHFDSENFIFFEKDIRKINELKIEKKLTVLFILLQKQVSYQV